MIARSPGPLRPGGQAPAMLVFSVRPPALQPMSRRPTPVLPVNRCARRAAAAMLVGLAAGFGGCASLQSSENFLGVITPYRIEVVQGNVVTREQAALVQPGMSRSQVRDALGSPLIADPFHADRWDYVFTIRRQGAAPQSHSVVVLFENDVLKSIDTNGDL